ncbi:MAG: transglutaminase-like domain-containing protein [Rickettsiales bacterium]|jgi:hypothetical protein|nr:transglutaminase-like domain-containing protein [Rickettsiales bacterium]
MKTVKIFVFFTIFLFYRTSGALADLKVKDWTQENVFTEYGQEVTMNFELIAENLEQNYYYHSWSFIFDKKERINIIEVSDSSNKSSKYTFGDNTLKIEFDKLFNKHSIRLVIKYQEFNRDIDKIPYIRIECVQIPKFAAGTMGNLNVKTLNDMDIYSLNENFSRKEDVYKWSGNIAKEGFYDCFKMTKKEAKWLVSTTFTVNSDGDFKNLKVKLPLNFIGGNNETLEYGIFTNQDNYVQNMYNAQDKGSATVEFKNFYLRTAVVKIAAKVKNNYNNFYWMNDFDINDTIKIKDEYANTYSSLINTIQEEDKSNLPTHIKVAKWVNKHITYTESFVGKKMESIDILRIGKGVCEHYAILYQDLLRSIGIPAKTVSGVSYNSEKKKFENHAWVMINYNSQWLPIDPTWGIYSGKLPISHIFMYNDVRNNIKFWYPSKLNMSSEIVNNAEFVEF